MELRPMNEEGLRRVVVDGTDTDFTVRKQGEYVVLESTSANFTMKSQVFTRPEALNQYVSDAQKYLHRKNKSKSGKSEDD